MLELRIELLSRMSAEKLSHFLSYLLGQSVRAGSEGAG